MKKNSKSSPKNWNPLKQQFLNIRQEFNKAQLRFIIKFQLDQELHMPLQAQINSLKSNLYIYNV